MIKKIVLTVCLGAIAQGAMATDVGVSISIGDPNFYGRLNIGNFPQPVVIYPQPVVIQPIPRGVVRQPVYLRVPPGQARNWRRHCARYNACGRPVYFVQDNWYQEVYAPRYRAGPDYAPRHEERREYRQEERRDDRYEGHERHGGRDHGGGPGNGGGHGNGNGGGHGNGNGGGHGNGHGRDH